MYTPNTPLLSSKNGVHGYTFSLIFASKQRYLLEAPCRGGSDFYL